MQNLYQIVGLLIIIGLSSSCQTLNFYQQAIVGQLEIQQKSRANAQVIAGAKTPSSIRRQLLAVEGIRRFARTDLLLPGEKSYGKYADLGREHVVWVIYAAPEFSLKPKTWHYPFLGELNYQGYFREADATRLASRLKAEGYDVFTGGVDAYSTLGWFHDPVLNTFVNYSDIDLAETIFHELTHRKVFRSGDTVFNESLASVVAEEGVQRWLRAQGRSADLKKYQGRLTRRRQFYQEIDHAKNALGKLYASAQSKPIMRREKAVILARLRDQFRELRRRWGGHGLETWLNEDINNGHIVSLQLYADLMPAFESLLKQCDGDLAVFYQKAKNRAENSGL